MRGADLPSFFMKSDYYIDRISKKDAEELLLTYHLNISADGDKLRYYWSDETCD